MITAVLDANVLASGFVRSNPAAASAQLIDAWLARAYPVTGDAKLQQLRTHSEVTILSPRAFLKSPADCYCVEDTANNRAGTWKVVAVPRRTRRLNLQVVQ